MEVPTRLIFLVLAIVVIVWVWWTKRVAAKRQMEHKQYVDWHRKMVDESVELTRQTLDELKAVHKLLREGEK